MRTSVGPETLPSEGTRVGESPQPPLIDPADSGFIPNRIFEGFRRFFRPSKKYSKFPGPNG